MIPPIDNRNLKDILLNGEPVHFESTEPEEQRTVEARWIIAALEAGKSVDIEHAFISGKLMLGYREIKSSVTLSHCVFGEEVNFHKTVFTRAMDLSGTKFGKGVNWNAALFQDDFNLSGSEFTDGQAAFANAGFQGAPRFDGVQFNVVADFRGASFGDAVFSASTFDKEAIFSGVTVAKAAGFRKVKFRCESNFTDFLVGADANFRDASFSGESSFVRARLKGRAMFEGASFDRGVNFGSAHLGGVVFFTVETCKGEAIFSGATFDRPAHFGKSDFGNSDSPNRTAFNAKVDFRGATFCSNLNVTAEFLQLVDFRGVRFDAGADFRDSIFKGKVFFSFARIAHSMEFPNTIFEKQTEFNGTFIATFVDFETARFLDDVSLKSASFRQMLLAESGVVYGDFQFGGRIDLRGCGYERVQIAKEGLESLTRKLRFEDYDRQPYTQLEKALRADGHDRLANDVYLKRQHLERKRYWEKRQGRKYVSSWLYWLVNYGAQPTLRLAVFALAILVLGYWIFQPNYAVVTKDPKDTKAEEHRTQAWSRLDAAAVSVHQFLPVDIPFGANYFPSNEGCYRFVLVASGLRLAGFIFIPVALAAFTGLLRAKP